MNRSSIVPFLRILLKYVLIHLYFLTGWKRTPWLWIQKKRRPLLVRKGIIKQEQLDILLGPRFSFWLIPYLIAFWKCWRSTTRSKSLIWRVTSHQEEENKRKRSSSCRCSRRNANRSVTWRAKRIITTTPAVATDRLPWWKRRSADAIRIIHYLLYPLTDTTRCRISLPLRHVTTIRRQRGVTVRQQRLRPPKSSNPNWSFTASRHTDRQQDLSPDSPTSKSFMKRLPNATTYNQPKYFTAMIVLSFRKPFKGL